MTLTMSPDAESQLKPWMERVRALQIVGWWELTSGATSAVSILDSGLVTGGDAAMRVVLSLALVECVVSIAGGLGLVRGWRVGQPLSLGCQALQALQLRAWGIMFAFSISPRITLLVLPHELVTVSLQGRPEIAVQLAGAETTAVGISLTTCLALFVLLWPTRVKPPR